MKKRMVLILFAMAAFGPDMSAVAMADSASYPKSWVCEQGFMEMVSEENGDLLASLVPSNIILTQYVSKKAIDAFEAACRGADGDAGSVILKAKTACANACDLQNQAARGARAAVVRDSRDEVILCKSNCLRQGEAMSRRLKAIADAKRGPAGPGDCFQD